MSDEPPTLKNQWELLSEDLQERILLQLPVSTAVRSASVCKRWRSIISSQSFSSQLAQIPSGRKPWFCLWGINELIHNRSVAFTFDPTLGRWFRVQTLRPPDFNRTSLAGCHGLFFAFSGSKVCFATNPTKMVWKETTSASSTRCYALMGAVGEPHCPAGADAGFSLVAVGGVLDGGDQRLVEMYRSGSHAWEACEPLPSTGFRDTVSCHWMSSAVLGHKLYVADFYGDFASLDTRTKAWSKVSSLSVPNLVSLFILACGGRLHAAVVCRPNHSQECLKVFTIDDDGDGDGDGDCHGEASAMDWHEVSTMPPHLFSHFENADEHMQASLKCVGSGTAFYVYSECVYSGYPVCMCELREGEYVWKQLPSLPSPPRFDRVVCCSMVVTPRACLERDMTD